MRLKLIAIIIIIITIIVIRHQTQTTKQKNLLCPSSAGAQKQNRLLVSRCLLPVALLVNTGLPASEFHQQQNAPAPTTGNTITAQQDQGITATRFVEDGSRVILSINPYAPGNNNFKISFLDSNRNPIDIKSVQLRYTQIEKGIGPINVDAQQISKGVFSANAAFWYTWKMDFGD